MEETRRETTAILGHCTWLVALVAVVACALPASGVTAEQARANAIVWLERSQNEDGSWGAGATQALVTAESLLALARAGRAGGPAAQDAIAWLRSQEYVSLDYRARAIRALAGAGVSEATAATDLVAIGTGNTGWGTVTGGATTSYDSALVLSAVAAAGVVPGDLAAKKAEVLGRRRSDAGWSGDGVPGSQGASDRTVTAEIVRALSGVATSSELLPSVTLLQSTTGLAATDTLELAARLAAIHAANATATALEVELLMRAPETGTWSTDPYVVALGLLAVATKPGASFGGGPTADDDGDAVQNQLDVFPQDPAEWADLDRDGIGDNHDTDRDGDDVANTQDVFPDDPNEFANTDGDALGDSADLDDDNDGLTDLEEAARGTDPRRADSDGDGTADTADPCPLVAAGTDADGDGACTPLDACPTDPNETSDLDHDSVCDNADSDDDGDGMSDAEELAAGTDPRNPASLYVITAADLWKDFDGDGLTNLEESFYHTSIFRADTDGDGATDAAEIRGQPATDPTRAASQPRAVVAVFGAMGQAPDASVIPARALYEVGEVQAAVTGGQSTAVASLAGSGLPSSGGGVVHLAGFQPMTRIGRDLDGDGVRGLAENAQRTSQLRVDTDGDHFVDGSDWSVALARLPGGWDLDGYGFVDGERDAGTDPANAADRPGKPGDVAPLGHPDGKLTAGDAAVELRLVADPTLAATLVGQPRQICEQAGDTDGDLLFTVKDAVFTVRQAVPGAP